MRVDAGSTNVSVYFYIVQDASATNPGEPVTGLLFSDIETGGSASYVRQGAARTELTLITLAGADAAHADGGFILVDNTNMPGVYRCDYPDAAFGAGVDQATLQIVVASAKNAVASPIFVDITAPMRGTNDAALASVCTETRLAELDAANLPTVTDGIQTDLSNATDGLGAIKTSVDAIPTTAMRGTDDALLDASAPTNFGDMAITITTGRVDIGTNNDKTGYSVSATGLDAVLAGSDFMQAVADDVWDEVLTGAVHNVVNSAGRRLRAIQDFGSYLGAIHIDTINGTAGTVVDENGTVDNPVDNLADALTLNTTLNFDEFHMSRGASITLVSNSDGFLFDGRGWTIALGGQSISNTVIKGATVSGTGTGAVRPTFLNCFLGTMTIVPLHALHCGFDGTITFSAAGDYTFSDCHSDIAGAGTPIIDTGAAVANVNLTMPHYSQGIEIRNLNNLGTDEFSISGQGQILYAASSSGTVNQRGDWKVTNTGGVTINEDDNTANIAATLVDTAVIGAAGAGLTDLGGMSTGMKAEVLVEVIKLLTEQMAESYAADGIAPTLAQALMLIQQSLHEFAISGVTRTVKKLDGTTEAATFTFDDGTNPTSTTRAT